MLKHGLKTIQISLHIFCCNLFNFKPKLTRLVGLHWGVQFYKGKQIHKNPNVMIYGCTYMQAF